MPGNIRQRRHHRTARRTGCPGALIKTAVPDLYRLAQSPRPVFGPAAWAALSVSAFADAQVDRGGEGGIRTPDTVARMPHFECGAFNHSATSPRVPSQGERPAMVQVFSQAPGAKQESRPS